MKKNIIFIFALLPIFVFGQGIEFFHGNWDEALAKAQVEDKPIFVDAFTTWCGPCKRMAKNIFTLEEVGVFFNDNFINMKLDMEKEIGMKFGMKYPVSAYPTLYFINQEGDILSKVVGGRGGEELIAEGKTALSSNDRSGSYAEKFENGDRDFELVYTYIQELNKVGKPSLPIANQYLREEPKISKQEKAKLLLEAVTELDSKLFDQLLELKSEAIKSSSKETFEEKIVNAGLKTVDKAIEYEYEDLLNEAIDKVKLAVPSQSDAFEHRAKMSYAKAFQGYDEWAKHAKKYIKKSGKDYETYKMLVVEIDSYQKKNDDAKKEMMKWYDEILKCEECKNEDFMVYSQFLLKAGNKEKAIEIAQMLFDKTKEAGEPTNRIEQFIKFLESQS